MKKYVLLSIIVLMQLTMSLVVWWSLDKDEAAQIHATDFWMLLNCLSWVFAFTLIAMLTTGLFRGLTYVVIAMWFGNLVDELLFDPTLPQWNDLVSLGIAYTIAVVLITKNACKKS